MKCLSVIVSIHLRHLPLELYQVTVVLLLGTSSPFLPPWPFRQTPTLARLLP